MIPLKPWQQRAYDTTRDSIWQYYQQLKAYRDTPTERKKRQLESKFDKLFLANTGWEELNAAMRKIHSKKAELLLVLEHPDLPLHFVQPVIEKLRFRVVQKTKSQQP